MTARKTAQHDETICPERRCQAQRLRAAAGVAVFLLLGCGAPGQGDEGHRRPASRAPASGTTTRPIFMHRDHRQLPIGTRIFIRNRAEYYLRPGDPIPPVYAHRVPDIIVVGP